ncbi:hypothetical protein C2E23DRAFT_926365 [Lenzites betulinus]|nr:hypothetical protein C2E23DRAFT_926365 [Lenzites betulinus]
MEAQDDPFQPGGPATSSKITLGMIITQLVTGYAFMDFLSTLSWDWQLLRGKHGCRIGTFLLYFGSRYLGITSVLATVIFLDTFPVVYINPLRYIAAVTAGFALGLAFSIILLRISFMYKKTWLCIVIDVLRFLFWGVLIRGMIQTPAVLNGRGFQYAQTACVLLLATVTFFAALLRAIYVCRAEHCFGISKLAHVVVREDVCELGVIWAGALVMSVSLWLNSLHFCLGGMVGRVGVVDCTRRGKKNWNVLVNGGGCEVWRDGATERIVELCRTGVHVV